ncbi:MAG: hypothetical protein LBV41_04220 [Cytophagaceae bacterium]|nr:hypothetical protein [Cytophagaceae bacterium]
MANGNAVLKKNTDDADRSNILLADETTLNSKEAEMSLSQLLKVADRQRQQSICQKKAGCVIWQQHVLVFAMTLLLRKH